MKNKETNKIIKLPIIKIERNANYTINKTENKTDSLLAKSNSSKYLFNKNDSSKKEGNIIYQRNKTIYDNITKIYSTFRKKFLPSKMLLSKSKDKEIIKEEEEEKKIKPKKYYYKIYSFGNDSSTIKKCFKHRINWEPEEKMDDGDKISFI